MDVFGKVAAQMATIGLPLFAVTLTAVPRANTPILLMLHWHGFRRESEAGAGSSRSSPVPGSALQVNERWDALDVLDEAMLSAAWQLGAWDLDRVERRGCNTVGAPEREALECRQAFGDHPFGGEGHFVAEAPDRPDLMQLGAEAGYIRWQFRPVRGGLWREVADDDSLAPDGSRVPPCPVTPQRAVGPRKSTTRYRLGRKDRLILL